VAIFSKKHLFIINPRSFIGPRDINRVIAEIVRCFDGPQAARRISGDTLPELPDQYPAASPYAIHVSRFPREAIIIIRKYTALTKMPVRVYAIGGNGVVFSCLNGIVGLPGVELAVVPYGTGSDFVQALGGREFIPQMRSIQGQIEAPAIPADIIDGGNIYALNSCAVGFEAMAFLNSYPILQALWKLRRRSPALTEMILRIAGVAVVFDKEVMEHQYRVRMDDEEIEGPMPLIHIANTPGYPVNKSVIPEAVPDDGLLDMLVYRNSSPLKCLRYMPAYLRGQHGKRPQVITYRRVRSVSVNSDRPFCIGMDGEVFFDTSFNIRVIPQAIRIASVGGRPFKNRGPDYGG
jgi:diacylglycerol kinase family enzyme